MLPSLGTSETHFLFESPTQQYYRREKLKISARKE